jgi:uridine kinase
VKATRSAPDSSTARGSAVAAVARAIAGLDPGHPVRVAVDGVGAAGKTVLADELASAVENLGRRVIRAGVDGFHRPRAERHQRGPLSPEGYFHDSFDHDAIRRALLDPLGPGGDRRYRTAVFDFRTDLPIEVPDLVAPDTSVLIFDGVFLLRPELRDAWDFAVFVDTSFEVTVARALERDLELFGTADVVRERYERRYVPGERLYLEEVRPGELADVVFGNDDPDAPTLRWRGAGGP